MEPPVCAIGHEEERGPRRSAGAALFLWLLARSPLAGATNLASQRGHILTVLKASGLERFRQLPSILLLNPVHPQQVALRSLFLRVSGIPYILDGDYEVPGVSSSGREEVWLVRGCDFVRRTTDKRECCEVNRAPLFCHAKEANLT